MNEIIIFTGAELRHQFMRKALALADVGCEINCSICEGLEQSLNTRVAGAEDADLRKRHVTARTRSERDFFAPFVALAPDRSRPRYIAKGAINEPENAEAIIDLNPHLIVAYGCSLIREPLISAFSGRILNVHLGLSPYYRGSGTNFWPLVEARPECVGATFLYMDPGIDTGEIIHQIRARVFPGDTPHQIGNRLICDIALVYPEIIRRFEQLTTPEPPPPPANPRLCRRDDFLEESVETLYKRFEDGMVAEYLENIQQRQAAAPIAVNPQIPPVDVLMEERQFKHNGEKG